MEGIGFSFVVDNQPRKPHTSLMSNEPVRLAVLVQNFYTAKLGPRRGDRRIGALNRQIAQPKASLLAIYSHENKSWRVADAGAWLEDDEDSWSIVIDANTRGLDIEARCNEIFAELGEK